MSDGCDRASQTSEMRFTPGQAAIISARRSGLLVAASAGTGKTYTLTHRILRRLLDDQDPLDLDRLLVVTFTDAAAKEMRDRIRSSLVKALQARPGDRVLQEQLEKVGAAQISTIHSFCREILKRYSYLLGLEPSLSVIDESEAVILKDTVIDRLFMDSYEADESHFIDLLDSYSRGLGDRTLKRTILDVYEFTTSIADAHQWRDDVLSLWSARSDELADHRWVKMLSEQVRAELAWSIVLMEKATLLSEEVGGPLVYASQLRSEKDELATALNALSQGEWDAAAASLPSFAKLKPCRSKDVDEAAKKRVQALRNAAKDITGKLKNGLFSRTLLEYGKDLPADRARVEAILDLAAEFDARYTTAKRQLGVVDFSDLERLALRLLHTPSSGGMTVAEHLQQQYDEVLVDEYQDTSQIQDSILYLVSKDGQASCPNRTLIGDVKQSIYRFRLADPSLFVDKLASYKKEPGALHRQIPLNLNFRSRPEVLEAVNFIFQQIMTREAAEIDYTPEDFLVCGASWYQSELNQAGVESSGAKPVEMYILDNSASKGAQVQSEEDGDVGSAEHGDSPDEAVGAMECEAHFMADRIWQLISQEDHIYDPDLKSQRQVKFGDIAILLRSTKANAETIRQVLQRRGVPSVSLAGAPLFAGPEVKLLTSLLQVIDNPRHQPELAAVLLSPVGGFTADELARIKVKHHDLELFDALVALASGATSEAVKANEFLTHLQDWQRAASLGPSYLLRQLLAQLGPAAFIQYAPDVPLRRRNLKRILTMAETFEENHAPALSAFVRHLVEVREHGRQDTEVLLSDFGTDAVKIMSIHKSKGLEFPVVFLPGLAKRFNLSDSYSDIQFDGDIGIAVRHVDTESKQKWPTLSSLAASFAARRKALAEEMRVLYVAMTRARERLILLGSGSSPARMCSAWADAVDLPYPQLPAMQLLSAKNALDWIGPTLMRHKDGQPLRELAECVQAPACVRIVSYPCCWHVSAGTALRTPQGEITLQTPLREEETEVSTKMRQLEPLMTHEDDGTKDYASLFAWRYPHAQWLGVKRAYAVTDLAEGYELPATAVRLAGQGVSTAKKGAEFHRRAAASAVRNVSPNFAEPTFLVRGHDSHDGAQRGSAVHRFMQLVPLQANLVDPRPVKAAIDTLALRGQIAREEARLIEPEVVASFFATDLGQLILTNCGTVQREIPFTIALPLNEVGPPTCPDTRESSALAKRPKSGTDDFTVLRGIIDLVVNGPQGLVVVDFKTDTIAQEAVYEYAARYFAQVRYYIKALEIVRKASVEAGYLAFLSAGVNIQVTR